MTSITYHFIQTSMFFTCCIRYHTLCIHKRSFFICILINNRYMVCCGRIAAITFYTQPDTFAICDRTCRTVI